MAESVSYPKKLGKSLAIDDDDDVLVAAHKGSCFLAPFHFQKVLACYFLSRGRGCPTLKEPYKITKQNKTTTKMRAKVAITVLQDV